MRSALPKGWIINQISGGVGVGFDHPAKDMAVTLGGSADRFGVVPLGGFVLDIFSHGTVHKAREDLQSALQSDPKVLALWESLTPLGRNEFICWVDDAKQAKTRQRRIQRTSEELLEGNKRPCCWVGCIHRTDKKPSPWQQAVLIDKKATKKSR